MASSSKKKWLKFLPVTLIVALVGLTPLFGVAVGSCMGYHDMVMDRLRACGLAGEVLGEDVGIGMFGMSCGSAESSGSSGRADWQLPVSGSKVSGSYSFYLEKHGAGWQLMSARLRAGGKNIDIVACAPGPAGDSPLACRGADDCAQASVRCFQNQDLVCAEKFARQACAAGNKPSCGNVAHILIHEKDAYAEAETFARQGCQAQEANSCNNLAAARRKQGKLESAYEAASKACGMGHDVGCSERALIDLMRGDASAGKRWAHKALKKGPKRPSKYRRLGHAYLFSGDANSAVSQYALALNLEKKGEQTEDSVKEDENLPQLDLIRDEIRELAPQFPNQSGELDTVIRRVQSMANAVEAGP